MANRTYDCGVPQDANADITVYPTVTDISVPTNSSLITPANNVRSATRERQETNPVARQASVLGIGVPYNPYTNVTSG